MTASVRVVRDATITTRRRLGRLVHNEAGLRAFVASALPGTRDLDTAVDAMRMLLRGYERAEAARMCGVSYHAISQWWLAFSGHVDRWLARERDGAKSQMARAQSSNKGRGACPVAQI